MVVHTLAEEVIYTQEKTITMNTITNNQNGLRQSQLFTKTRKQGPTDEVSRNAELLIRAGFLHKEMAGVYSYLPLGLRTINKVNALIREEMASVGGIELRFSTLQDKSTWEKTDRWSDENVDVWFKTKLQNGTEIGLGWTHEEPITKLMKDHVSSYRDLPFYPYQIQNKFRNEVRAKSGIMRTREFLMKDLYSFSRDTEEHATFYEAIALAYMRVFVRAGLGGITYKTFASGGAFAKYSHEFQTISEAGEDIVYVNEEQNIAINKEVFTDEVLADLGLKKEDCVEKKAIEVGNIFNLGTRFSDAHGLTYKNETGEDVAVVMGSYGIGPNRLMGTVAELWADEKGLVWPEIIAPYRVHLVRLGDSEKVVAEADALYATLLERGIDVLYDDREVRPGEKFADSDLIGLPTRVVISENTIKDEVIEVVDRKTGEKRLIKEEELLSDLTEKK